MSEGAADVVYLIIVVVASCTTLGKYAAWRRERSTALRLITTCSAVGVVAFLVATPLVWRALARLTGSANVAEPVVFVCILAFFAHTHVMSLMWWPAAPASASPVARPSKAAPGRGRLVRPLAVYCAAAVAMVAGFAAGDLDDAAHPLDFNIAYGQDPGALVMLAAFQLGLAYASVSTAVRFRRNAHSSHSDPRLRRALRHISLATWFIAGYVACVMPATVAGALGSHALDPLHSLGPVSGTVGALVINWGFSGAAISLWRADRRDYLALTPLWELTHRADPRIALDERNRVTDLGLLYVRDWHLVTRAADILSGIRSLYPYFDDEPVVRVHLLARARGWPLEDERAAAAAALVLRAVALAESGAERGGESGLVLPGGSLEPGAQRTHLVRVAGYLDHPDVLAAAGLAEARRPVPAP
ncbi:DUF6545 domain-containing protein [Streptomyces sp. NPDC051555]|uniref:DUF6545 domain-containing protein n=1 Tax=Streptomyces sp. NPDC051555 TaxID=3365657 RepID=UPI0037BA30A3